MYIYIYINIYIYIYIYTYMCAYMFTNMHIHIYRCIYIYTHTQTRTHKHIPHSHAHAHSNIYTLAHTCTHSYTHPPTHTPTHPHTRSTGTVSVVPAVAVRGKRTWKTHKFSRTSPPCSTAIYCQPLFEPKDTTDTCLFESIHVGHAATHCNTLKYTETH